MPFNNIVFIAANDHGTGLGQAETVIVRLQIKFEEGGKYLIIGKVVIRNDDDGGAQTATARLTTLDGKTELDRADVRLEAGGAQEISLQATISLDEQNSGPIVDLRCSTFRGGARQARLFAVLVDGLQEAGV